MEIKTAEFITSLANYGPFDGKGLPQIAVVGKSNVGKSTLINKLCRRNKLARTSATPGKTRLINIFLLNSGFHLIDPGDQPGVNDFRVQLLIFFRQCLDITGFCIFQLEFRLPLQQGAAFFRCDCILREPDIVFDIELTVIAGGVTYAVTANDMLLPPVAA